MKKPRISSRTPPNPFTVLGGAHIRHSLCGVPSGTDMEEVVDRLADEYWGPASSDTAALEEPVLRDLIVAIYEHIEGTTLDNYWRDATTERTVAPSVERLRTWTPPARRPSLPMTLKRQQTTNAVSEARTPKDSLLMHLERVCAGLCVLEMTD